MIIGEIKRRKGGIDGRARRGGKHKSVAGRKIYENK